MKATVGLVSLATICAVAPISSHAIERLYSQRIYANLQPALTSLSNVSPFALMDVLIVVVAGIWMLLAIRDLLLASRTGWARAAGRIVRRTVAWSAAGYLLFLAVWGFNYRRVRLVDKLEFSGDAVTSEAALTLATRAVDQLNELHRPAHEQGWGRRPQSILRWSPPSIAPCTMQSPTASSSPAARSARCSTGISAVPRSAA